MKVLVSGVDLLPNYTNKKTGVLQPSVLIHTLEKYDGGFRPTRKPVFYALSDDVIQKVLSTVGSLEKLVNYQCEVYYNQSGFVEDFKPIEPIEVNIKWKQ